MDLRVAASTGPGRVSAIELYERGLASQRLWARDGSGGRFAVPISEWTSSSVAGDASLVERCRGPVLDVGCGPGRLVSALSRRGVDALGIDISARAVARARKIGANALRCSVFGSVPNAGGWRCAILADGNIGIGGDPQHLLSTLRRLVGPNGQVIAEVAAPHVATAVRDLRLEDELGRLSEPFPWAEVSAADVGHFADASGLEVSERWTSSGRWFVTLRPGRCAASARAQRGRRRGAFTSARP
jgi:SAM-dependent methyltransferase